MSSDYQEAERNVLLRYGAALALVLFEASMRWWLLPWIGTEPFHLTFYLTVLLAGAYGGFGPGVLATLLGGTEALVLEMLPLRMVPFDDAAGRRIVVFFVGGLGISWIAGRMHRAQRMARADAMQMRRLSEELKVANQRLVESDRSKDRFVALVAHELRNPLAPIRNGVSLLESGQLDPSDLESAVGMIGRQVDQMDRIVNDLLDAARIRQHKLDIHREPVDLREIVCRAVDDHRQHFQTKSVLLDLQQPPDPVPVFADPARLGQVISNLLHNAFKFTPAGGDVHVEVIRRREDVVLQVRDTGVGIEPDALARIFQPFEQADGMANRRAGGLGVGLALVKSIVELHGGSVEARSRGRDKGAELRVTLPLDASPKLDDPLSTFSPVPDTP